MNIRIIGFVLFSVMLVALSRLQNANGADPGAPATEPALQVASVCAEKIVVIRDALADKVKDYPILAKLSTTQPDMIPENRIMVHLTYRQNVTDLPAPNSETGTRTVVNNPGILLDIYIVKGIALVPWKHEFLLDNAAPHDALRLAYDMHEMPEDEGLEAALHDICEKAAKELRTQLSEIK